MSVGNYRIVYKAEEARYKVCRIWFGSDGSYYVSSPYHKEHKAFLFKIRVNYARDSMEVQAQDFTDSAQLDDDGRKLKLSHHPDGFVQFSGQGILSGRAADGTAKGMGVMSWPLDRPVRGPTFGMVIRGVEDFEPASPTSDSDVVFDQNTIGREPGSNTFNLEGHYLPAYWRRFVARDQDGTFRSSVVHPSSAILTLTALFPRADCVRQNFIGIVASESTALEENAEGSFFAFSGPTGDLRKNLEGEPTADSIQCMFPRASLSAERILNYSRDDIETRS